MSEFLLDGNREMMIRSRTELILSPLKNQPQKWEKIKLSGKSFDIQSAEYIAELIPSLTSLKSVDISDIIAGKSKEEANRVLQIICDSLKENINIVEVDISDNALGEKGIESCASLLSKSESIQTLILNNDGLSPLAAKALKERMIKGDNKMNLRKLHFFNNCLKDGGAIEIAEIVNHCPELVDFRFSSTRSGLDGILKLTTSLFTTTNLTALDLSDNSAGNEEGSIKLASLIKHQKNLRKLNVAAMGLRDDGFQRVAESISELSLTELDLSSNELTSKGIKNIITALKSSHSSIQRLNLDENELGDNVNRFVLFSDFLKDNEFKSLSHLFLKLNQLKKASVLSILSSLDNLSSLTCLDLNENLLSKSDLEDVEQVLGESKREILQSMDDCYTDEDGSEGGDSEGGSDDEKEGGDGEEDDDDKL